MLPVSQLIIITKTIIIISHIRDDDSDNRAKDNGKYGHLSHYIASVCG